MQHSMTLLLLRQLQVTVQYKKQGYAESKSIDCPKLLLQEHTRYCRSCYVRHQQLDTVGKYYAHMNMSQAKICSNGDLTANPFPLPSRRRGITAAMTLRYPEC